MKKKHNVVLLYSLFFCTIVGFILWTFAKYRKGFICGVDGLPQHFITLNYFKQILEKLITTGEISTFTWSIGFGMDMFANLAYYIFGDPLSYLCIFVQEKYLYIFYYVLIFVRMYLIGLAFIAYCKYKKINSFASVVGALMYTFCAFVLYLGVRHPYFINAMIFFPLLMIGIEKIILENKKIYYIIIVALTCISNFYFAYSMFLIIAIYGSILVIYTYKSEGIKAILVRLLKVLGCSIVGIMLSAIVLIPTGYAFLSSTRISEAEIFPYSLEYYRKLLPSIILNNNVGYEQYIGVHVITLISIPLFIKNRKENYPIFLLLVMLVLPVLISQIASIFCGFSFPSNRWTVALIFIFSYITAMFINKNRRLDMADLKCISIFLLIYLTIIYILRTTITLQFEVNMILIIALLLIFYQKEKIENIFKKANLYKIVLIMIIILGLLYAIYYMYDVEGVNYASQYINFNSVNKKISTVNDKFKDYDEAITFIKNKDKSFYRIGKSNIELQNISLMKGYNSISYYYSITPQYYQILAKDLENAQRSVSRDIKEFDYRTKITTLLGNKYYIANKNNIVPYGYELINEYTGNSKIYENKYSLPFAVLYTDYITQEEYKKLNSLEEESSLLKTTVLEDSKKYTNLKHNDNIVNYIKANSTNSINYKIEDKNKILKDKNNIEVKSNEKGKNQIELKFDKVENSEIYIYIRNLRYEPYSKKEMIKNNIKKPSDETEKRKIKNQYKWYQKNYKYTVEVQLDKIKVSETTNNYKTSPYYIENTDFLMNLGYYSQEENKKITLTLNQIGNYTFDSIEIIAVPMNDYAEDIDNLRKSNFEVSEYSDGMLKGNVNSKEAGVLQFSTLYSKGWKVYVDGQKVDTFISNNYFLGIAIEEGAHEIYMKYEVPYLNIGIITTIMGLIFFIILCFIEKNKIG